MRGICSAIVTLAVALPGVVQAQVENADFRIRADLRTPRNGAWPQGESVGNADFRVHSRFLQLYYGGVRRADDFKFSVQVDFSGVSDFANQFPGSIYNTSYDAYIEDMFIGRVPMGADGIAELTYDSRHAELPDLPLPAAFPEPVDAGQIFRLYAAAGGPAPAIGSPRPLGTPLFQAEFGEQFRRGDVNQDRRVDDLDFAVLASNFDPFHRLGLHVGPAAGDFSGDSLSDMADYDVMAANWTDGDPIPTPPPPVIGCAADFNGDGQVNPDDIGDFVNCYFAVPACPGADFNADGAPNPDDLGDFINTYFGSCA